MREGIEFHIEGLRADNEPIPEPTIRVARIPISALAISFKTGLKDNQTVSEARHEALGFGRQGIHFIYPSS